MTNIEYYGFKNLKYETYNAGFGLYVCEIYYKPKHNKNNILLRRFENTEAGLLRDKTRWLLEKPSFPMYIETDYFTGMKHRRKFPW